MTKYVLYILLATLLSACKDADNELHPEPDDDLVRINVITPKINTRMVTEPMPENSTIRLYVYKSSSWGPATAQLVEEKTYRVDANGGTVLCTVDPDTGEPTGDITNTALHLPADTYNFYSISPAIKLSSENILGLPALQITHGSKYSLRTSIKENEKIEYYSGSITGGRPGIYNLVLDVHTLLTSRITFKIKKGDNVGTMDLVDMERVSNATDRRSFVIDNLPPDNYRNFNFVIGNQRIIQMEVADGRGTLSFSKNEIEEKAPEADHSFYVESELLPCRLLDAGGVPIPNATEDDLPNISGSMLEKRVTEIRVHLNVSENAPNAPLNYKMFSVRLPEEGFLRGKSYNYTLLVEIGGILVSSWNVSDWTTTIE